ncbi:DUF6477 family protein [Limimaricola pyoseonensis]|uniref:Uncharacterized protein n=1 Tax=Limimaricola pyoseonensis TaxID=521013 RepID=A0A1G7AF07_9RHOB|nr:DUF6477 family protein [Limimaricola pyoseonensis]SDE13389.1 hypothetical protein SAMN04488567_0929 [Limimaricola pyoseonensis]
MQDLLTQVSRLTRPALLVRAARFGVDGYDRARHLGRALGSAAPARPGPALAQLLEREALLDRRRRSGKGDYSAARHTELLIAVMGEARALRAARAS